MSIDLDWDKLGLPLSSSLVDVLNRQLVNTPRPSFIGPIEVTSLEFGSTAPDVELVDLRDIYSDFLEDDEDDDEDRDPVKVTERVEDDELFEWVSHRAAGSDELGSQPRDGEIEHSLPPQAPDAELEQPLNNLPNLQLHLHINWNSNLRITLTTSLLINYPSPMFMSLPIKLSVTGLLFNGEVAMAYEGQRNRVHLCILDELDPYGPACNRSKRGSMSNTPPELDEDMPFHSSKPLPVGQRLLPSIFIESEIGQVDKHVLKNVTRVERFITDVVRKTIEEELVFPNFHTLVMGDQ